MEENFESVFIKEECSDNIQSNEQREFVPTNYGEIKRETESDVPKEELVAIKNESDLDIKQEQVDYLSDEVKRAGTDAESIIISEEIDIKQENLDEDLEECGYDSNEGSGDSSKRISDDEDGTDSEDGLDSDDDSLAEPDFSTETCVAQSSSLKKKRRTAPDDKPVKLNLHWRKENFEPNAEQFMFKGNRSLSPDILALKTPIQFFSYLFPQKLIQRICEETNLYQLQKDPSSTFRVSELDVRQFIGVVYVMSLAQLPSVAHHWNPILRTPLILATMSAAKFKQLRQTLHFNDNTKNSEHDRMFKIRPVVDFLNEAFSKVPMEEHLCVDEQMCSTETLKRSNPNKQHKWGYKVFVLSDVSGFAYTTEIENGKENMLEDEPDLGASSNVVVRLARMIPRHQNFKLYFDNCFTSLRLLEYLAKDGIYSLGTVRRKRIPGCKMLSEEILMKKEQGYSEEYVADVNGIDVSTVVWKDNKIVYLASTFAGQKPFSSNVNIKRPNVVGEYNRHIGSVKLLNNVMSLYKIQLRSKRWHMRLFYHYLDLTMANAWLLYKRVAKHKNLPNRRFLSSADFRLQIGMILCKMRVKRSLPALYVPPKSVCKDQIEHLAQWSDTRIKCKFPKCLGYTNNLCEKCGVALCNIKTRPCFKNFHLPKRS